MVKHTFQTPGLHVAVLQVTDDKGESASVSVTINVTCVGSDVAPWNSLAIGTPLWEGCVLTRNECMDLTASGQGFSRSGDEIHFLHLPSRGDVSLTTRIQGAELESGAKAGIMIRASTDPDSVFFFINVRGTAEGNFRPGTSRRTRTGSGFSNSTHALVLEPPLDVFLRLERQGDVFIGSVSSDGQEWLEVRKATISNQPEEMLAGPALTAEDDDDEGLIARATFCELDGFPTIPNTDPRFRRGDTDASGVVDISDPIFNLTFQFVGGIDELPCRDSADVDDSGVVDISDPISNLTFQFVGGGAMIPPPFGSCGPDPTKDELDCLAYPSASCEQP